MDSIEADRHHLFVWRNEENSFAVSTPGRLRSAIP
jgi:hypothetical protein